MEKLFLIPLLAAIVPVVMIVFGLIIAAVWGVLALLWSGLQKIISLGS